MIEVNPLDSWIYKFFYDSLVKWPAGLLSGASEAITWLSNKSLINYIFKVNDNQLTPPHLYDVFTYFGIGLLLIFICLGIIKSLVNGATQSVIVSSAKNIAFFILLIILIPTAFWCLNMLIGTLTNVIFQNKIIDSESFANILAGVGWAGTSIPSEWTYHEWPDFNNYSITVAGTGIIAALVMFFFLTFALVKRLFTIFVYYIQLPYIAAKCSGTNDWTSLFKWKDDLIAAFISSFVIILSVVAYSELITRLIQILNNDSSMSWAVKAFLQISITIGGAFSIYGLAHSSIQFLEGSFNYKGEANSFAQGTKKWGQKGFRQAQGRLFGNKSIKTGANGSGVVTRTKVSGLTGRHSKMTTKNFSKLCSKNPMGSALMAISKLGKK